MIDGECGGLLSGDGDIECGVGAADGEEVVFAVLLDGEDGGGEGDGGG